MLSGIWTIRSHPFPSVRSLGKLIYTLLSMPNTSQNKVTNSQEAVGLIPLARTMASNESKDPARSAPASDIDQLTKLCSIVVVHATSPLRKSHRPLRLVANRLVGQVQPDEGAGAHAILPTSRLSTAADQFSRALSGQHGPTGSGRVPIHDDRRGPGSVRTLRHAVLPQN